MLLKESTPRRRADTSQRTIEERIDTECVFAQRPEIKRLSFSICLDGTQHPQQISKPPSRKVRSQRASLARYSNGRSGRPNAASRSSAIASIRQHPEV